MNDYQKGQLRILSMILHSDIISEALPKCEKPPNRDEDCQKCTSCVAWKGAQVLRDGVDKLLKM